MTAAIPAAVRPKWTVAIRSERRGRFSSRETLLPFAARSRPSSIRRRPWVRQAAKEPVRDQTPHDVVADPASREVIYRERDVRANLGEHPDHALLRQRAYRLPHTSSAETPLQPNDPHADFKA